MSLNSHPGFVFRGKTYKTIRGLCNALAKDSGANEISGVDPNTRIIEARIRTKAGDAVVKRYCTTAPVEGQKQHIAECHLKSELDRAMRNALVASAYNVVVAMRPVGTDHGLPGGLRMSSVGLPDEPRKLVMMPAVAETLPLNHRIALLIAWSSVLEREQASGQQMIRTFADCNEAIKFVNC